jgi:hypothetical protein
MRHHRFISCALLVLSASVAGCEGLHAPTAEEKAARRIDDAVAKASALSRRIASAPGAVGRTIEEDGATREIQDAMLSPAEGARQLRELASQVASAGAGQAQRKAAGELAARLRRDALTLDLIDLERLSAERGAIAREVERRLGAIRTIEASGDLRLATAAQARIDGMQAAVEKFDEAVEAERQRGEDVKGKLEELDGFIADQNRRADLAMAASGELLAKAMTSSADEGSRLAEEARNKAYEAQDLRMQAAEADRQASELRSTVRIAEMATADTDATATFLTARVEESREAAKGARGRAEAAKTRIDRLIAETGELMKEFTTLNAEQCEPVSKAIDEALQDGALSSGGSGLDGAALALARARFAAITVDAIDQGVLMAAGAAAASGGQVDMQALAARLATARTAEINKASAALLDARDALSGLEGPTAAPMMASIEQLAAALGIELAEVKRPEPIDASDAADGEQPAPDAEPTSDGSAEGSMDEAGAPNAEPGADSPDAPPAADPASDPAGEPGADPSEEPASEPSDTPEPPAAEPSDEPDSPNK